MYIPETRDYQQVKFLKHGRESTSYAATMLDDVDLVRGTGRFSS